MEKDTNDKKSLWTKLANNGFIGAVAVTLIGVAVLVYVLIK